MRHPLTRLRDVLLLALVDVPLVLAAGTGGADFGRLLETDDTAAQVTWATRFEHGEGVPRDYDRAVRLYCEAAWQGSAAARYALGWMYANGRGVAHDEDLAAAWFEQAVAAGDAYAARMLARVDRPARAETARCVRPGGDEVLPLPDGVTAADRGRITRLVRHLAPGFGLEPALVLAVIEVESNFNPAARSPKNAQGLMQLIPATAHRFGVHDILHPRQNLAGGMAYLSWLLEHFHGDLALALAGYNAGEAAVRRYRGIPPFAETRRYVKAVLRLYRPNA